MHHPKHQNTQQQQHQDPPVQPPQQPIPPAVRHRRPLIYLTTHMFAICVVCQTENYLIIVGVISTSRPTPHVALSDVICDVKKRMLRCCEWHWEIMSDEVRSSRWALGWMPTSRRQAERDCSSDPERQQFVCRCLRR